MFYSSIFTYLIYLNNSAIHLIIAFMFSNFRFYFLGDKLPLTLEVLYK